MFLLYLGLHLQVGIRLQIPRVVPFLSTYDGKQPTKTTYPVILLVLVEPAPNTYKLPTTVGSRNHDPTKRRGPQITMGSKLKTEPPGLGPGMYKIQNKTRLGPALTPHITIATKFSEGGK